MSNLLVSSTTIKESKLLKEKELINRLYIFPFLLLHSIIIGNVLYHHLFSKDKWNDLLLVPLVISVGLQFIAWISCFWSLKWMVLSSYTTVSSLKDASFIMIIPTPNNGKEGIMVIIDNNHFFYQQMKFTFDEEKKIFNELSFPISNSISSYYLKPGNDGHDERSKRVSYYGKNVFNIPKESFIDLLKEHLVAPFFVFQLFCVILWCLDEYWYYSLFTLFMLVMFECTLVIQRLKNISEFQTMNLPISSLTIWREGRWVKGGILSEDLVPGDIILLGKEILLDSEDSEVDSKELVSYTKSSNAPKDSIGEFTVPCDLLMLSGSNLIVNEAMISGESTPLMKEPLTAIVEDSMQVLRPETDNRGSILLGGTKIMQFGVDADETLKTSSDIPSMKGHCIAYCLRTGFNTTQGKLVRTMVFTTDRMTANSIEAFVFIGFLLIFAIAASSYVLWKCWGEEGRNKGKLLLQCTMILTAVIPSELPMELSMAVNNSLISLSKHAIFAMEPFRIPLAGKLDICCFDKTGTLTGENLVVQGVFNSIDLKDSGVAATPNGSGELKKTKDGISKFSELVIATCHSLFIVDAKGGKRRVVGDPMEKVSLSFVDWKIEDDSTLMGPGGDIVKIIHRNQFNSTLKRMSCVIELFDAKNNSKNIYSVCKGAPEVIEPFLISPPSWYRSEMDRLAHQGSRVLTLAHKSLSTMGTGKNRSECESGLTFDGFLVFHCPLKPDSKDVIMHLRESKHHLVMITGDNPLTAIHTAFEVGMVSKPVILWKEVDGKIEQEFFDSRELNLENFHRKLPSDIRIKDLLLNKEYLSSLREKYEFAITGSALDFFFRENPSILRLFTVIARASPQQKESLLCLYKEGGLYTLMCGDGTNDVGALKQSHIGVALLDGKPGDIEKIQAQQMKINLQRRQIAIENNKLKWQNALLGPDVKDKGELERQRIMKEKISSLTEKLSSTIDDDEVPRIKLGDASVAAPFTSKLSTIQSVVEIIRQGRCTLVTTMQMYKILALNSLITAYSLSVIHLEGIRSGDFQSTISGMLLASCFMFLSKSKPLDKLSDRRPQHNIFNFYVVTSIIGQFALHVWTLVWVMSSCNRWIFPLKMAMLEKEKLKFTPSLINTAIFLLSLLMQVSTFVVNYQGRPFREGMWENIPLRNSLSVVSGIAIIAALEIVPQFNSFLQLVQMPPSFKMTLISAMAIDFLGCMGIEWISHRLFFDSRGKLERESLF